MTTPDVNLRCPRCKGRIAASANGCRCSGCSSEYHLSGGIFDFRCQRKDYYFNPVSRQVMSDLTKSDGGEAWPGKIRTFLRHVGGNPDWLDNLVVDGRYAWKLLLELPPDAVVLDLGCGLGNVTKNLAPHVAKVYALDLTWERLEFARLRFSLFNHDDEIVLIAGGDGRFLPFAEDVFDCVILSGVLEWIADDDSRWSGAGNKLSKTLKMIGSYFGETNPRREQLTFLKEIRRVLKRSGQLFIAIENRLNYEYFGRRPDHHSGLRYGSLLPRFLSNLYSIAVSRQPYRTYTYSIPGYRRLLRAAGFSRTEFFGLFPGYSGLEELAPVHAEIPYWRACPPSGLRHRIKWNRFFVPAYGIVAQRSGAPGTRLLDRVLQRIRDDRNLAVHGSSIELTRCEVTGKDKVVLTGTVGPEPVVIKIPSDRAAAVEERNHRFLHVMRRTEEVPTPTPLARGEDQRVRYFVEQRIVGTLLCEYLADQGRAACLSGVAGLLVAINPTLGSAKTVPLVGELFARLVEKPLETILSTVDDSELGPAARDHFRSSLYGREVKLGVVHGDLSVSNIFVEDGRIVGLIDWENGQMRGLPVLDAFNYLESVHRLFEPKATIVEFVSLLAQDRWPVAEEYAFLGEQCARCGVETDDIARFVYLYWLHHVAPQVRFTLAYDVGAIETRIARVLRSFTGERSQGVGR